MTKDYKKLHEEKIEALRKVIYSSDIYDEVKLIDANNQRINEIKQILISIHGTPVNDAFQFKAGKLIGIIRSICMHGKFRAQICEALDFPEEYVDMANKVIGNLPYCVKKSNTIDYGRPMDTDRIKPFLKIVGAKLGILVDDSDLTDLSAERWQRLYESEVAKAIQTVKIAEENASLIPEEGYEE